MQNDLQEVQNYIITLDYAIKRLNDLPLSLRLIKEIHHHLMQGVRGSHATPGEFRRSQNWVGAPGCTLNTAQRGIQKLEDAKIIKKTNSGKRDKIYCATEILTILAESTKINMNSQ